MQLNESKASKVEAFTSRLNKLVFRFYMNNDPLIPFEPAECEPVPLSKLWQVDTDALEAEIRDLKVEFSGRTAKPIVGVCLTNGNGPVMYHGEFAKPLDVLVEGQTITVPLIKITSKD